MSGEGKSDLTAGPLDVCSTEDIIEEMQKRCKSLFFISLNPNEIIGSIHGVTIYDVKRLGVLQWENESVKAALTMELENALHLIKEGD